MKYNWRSKGPEGCDSHCIEHPCGMCVHGRVGEVGGFGVVGGLREIRRQADRAFRGMHMSEPNWTDVACFLLLFGWLLFKIAMWI